MALFKANQFNQSRKCKSCSNTPNKIKHENSDISNLLSTFSLSSSVAPCNQLELCNYEGLIENFTCNSLQDAIDSKKINNKAKFKTIKILVASNHKEFSFETQCLINEVQPELQQYFMQFGYDFHFIDFNFNNEDDSYLDPYFFEYIKNELDECYEYSDACFFMSLIGNKYGYSPLPIEINHVDYELIKQASLNLKIDFEFFKSWYLLDEQTISPVYKLRPMVDMVNNEQSVSNQNSVRKTYEKLSNIIQESLKKNGMEFKDHNKLFLSANEQLTRLALSKNPEGCFVVQRHIENLAADNPKAFNYIDSDSNHKHLTTHTEKQSKFYEFVASQLKDHNLHQFSLHLDEKNMELFEKWFTYSEEEFQENSTNPTKFDAKLLKYYQKFNSIIIYKLKNIIEKHIFKEKLEDDNEATLYQEIERHLHKYQSLTREIFFLSSEFNKRLNLLIDVGKHHEHFPLFIYGCAVSGKTLTLVNFAQVAIKNLQEKNCQLIVKFSDLTSQVSTFESLMLALCVQLSVLNERSVLSIKNKAIPNLVDFFFKMCQEFSFSKPHKNLLILIDGLKDFNIEYSMIKKSNVANNQILWLFKEKLPPRVHMIVTIKRLFNKSKLNSSFNSLLSNGSSIGSIDENTVSLFLNSFNERTNSTTDAVSLFELPFYKLELKSEMCEFIKIELAKKNKFLSQNEVAMIFQNALNSPRQLASTETENNLEEHFFPYINTMIKEISDSYCSLFSNTFIEKKSLPLDYETIIKLKLHKVEKNVNTKIFGSVCKYITASVNGVTEMELFDLLSCNNGIFLNIYTNNELPPLLRFPCSYWLLIKNCLGAFLTKNFLDNKVTFNWTNELVKKIMKQKYFNNVEQIRLCHKDIANYYLESFIDSKPLVDLTRNIQLRNDDARRFVAQQPLLYSENLYNFRRLSELWYHLMNSGDIQRLKESTLFNFEYLLAKCHGNSIYNLLNDLDIVLRRILDPDIILLNLFLKRCAATLHQDPLRLAPEILAILRSIKKDYGEHIDSLFQQASIWCDQHESPILIPLTFWLESPENLLISRIDHLFGVFKIAVTTFNQHVFFSNSNMEICMYHIPSKKMVRKFTGHTDTINSLQITSNNKYLISCSLDKSLRIWNLISGEIENTYYHQTSQILCAVLSHSDEYIITGTAGNLINVIRIETGEIVHTGANHVDAVTALAITKNDTILISASTDKTIIRWCLDENGLEVVDIILNIFSPITSMVITKDMTFIIVACENKKVQTKSLITGSDVHELPTFNSSITALAVSNDSKLLYVACSDWKLYLFNLLNKELLAVLIEQNGIINDLRISEDNSFLFSSSANSLFVLNTRKKILSKKQTIKQSKAKVLKAMSLSKEGDLAVTGYESGKVSLWNIIDGELVEDIIEPKNVSVSAVVISNAHLFCVVAFFDCSVIVYDIELGDVAVEFKEHTNPVLHLFILDKRVLSSDGQNSCKIWYAHSGQLLESITVDCSIFTISPNKKFVVSGKGDNILKIWNFNEYKVIRKIEHTEKITVTVFTKDSNFVITGSEDFNCKIWELETGKLIQVLIEHTASITSINVKADRNIVLTGSKDTFALLWNFRDGCVIHKMAHKDEIVDVHLTSNGLIAITASKDSIVNVWSVSFGSLLTSINLQYPLVNFLATAEGDRLVFRFEDCQYFPIVGLSLKNMKNFSCSTHFSSLSNIRSNDGINLIHADNGKKILPIRLKPFITKRSRLFIKFLDGPQSSEGMELTQSETNSLEKTEEVTTYTFVSQKSSLNLMGKSQKSRQKILLKDNQCDLKVESKCKKSKICCLI